MKFNNRMKQEGEMFVRRMSNKAQQYYAGTDCCVIYADDRNDDKAYMVVNNGFPYENTLEDIESIFESLVYDECEV